MLLRSLITIKNNILRRRRLLQTRLPRLSRRLIQATILKQISLRTKARPHPNSTRRLLHRIRITSRINKLFRPNLMLSLHSSIFFTITNSLLLEVFFNLAYG